MIYKKSISALLYLAFFGGSVFAQVDDHCGTTSYLARKKSEVPSLENRMNSIETQTQQWVQEHHGEKLRSFLYIPVVVHVVYKTAAQNISDAQIASEITVLNEDYSFNNPDRGWSPSVFWPILGVPQIQFCMAERDPNGNWTAGITRTQTNVDAFTNDDKVKFDSLGGINAWPADKYLNIWVCNLGNGYLGYSSFPGFPANIDGVVIKYTCFGRGVGALDPTYNKGRSCTHEIGHWMNLIHIWGDSNCGNDYVSDTPIQLQANYGCPTFPHVTNCSGNAPNGDLFMDFMDYTDDRCMNMFSAGQVDRMNASLVLTRSWISTSLSCVINSTANLEALSNEIQFYPNPSSCDYSITLPNYDGKDMIVDIYNLEGKKLREIKFSGIKNQKAQISLNDLESGIYFAKVSFGDILVIRKLILQK